MRSVVCVVVCGLAAFNVSANAQAQNKEKASPTGRGPAVSTSKRAPSGLKPAVGRSPRSDAVAASTAKQAPATGASAPKPTPDGPRSDAPAASTAKQAPAAASAPNPAPGANPTSDARVADLQLLEAQNELLIERVKLLEAQNGGFVARIRDLESELERSKSSGNRSVEVVGPILQVAPPPANLRQRVNEACGVTVPAASGANDITLISSQRRARIDQELRLPGAERVDIESIDADVCFDELSPDYVQVSLSGRRQQAVTADDSTPLGRWLIDAAPHGVRIRLAPGSECGILLDLLQDRAVWVEDGGNLSLCEHDAFEGTRINPTKIEGYSGVIVVKVKRG
jgi:hypothetical protein